MKIFKTAKYKQAFEFNSRKELAYELLNNWVYNSGLGSSLQLLASRWSYGKDVPNLNREIDKAIQELEEMRPSIDIKGQPYEDINRTSREITDLQNRLKGEKQEDISSGF